MNKHLKQIVPSIPSDLISVKEASKITEITERTIWRKIREGKLKAWGPRRCFRISLSELLPPVSPMENTRICSSSAPAAQPAGIAGLDSGVA